MKDPLVAHCITGALRSFPEPRVFGSLREKLLDAFSSRYKVFVVVSFDCRVRTVDYLNASKSSHRASCAKDYFTSDIDRALAYLGAESFEVVPNRNAPSVDCPPARGEVDRHPAYWLQQQKTTSPPGQPFQGCPGNSHKSGHVEKLIASLHRLQTRKLINRLHHL